MNSDRTAGRRQTALDRKRAFRAAVMALASAGALYAQVEQVHRREGPQLYGASVFGAYYSQGLGRGLGLTGLGDTLQADSAMGGTATVGWASYRERSNFAVTYSPAFVMSARRPEFHSFAHGLSVTAGKRLSGRWMVTIGVNGALNSTVEFLFTPTLFSQIAAVPTTFEDLVQGMLRNTYNNFELASLLTGAPLIESPARSLLFGDRMLTASLRAGLSYSITPRTSVSFSATGTRHQYLAATERTDVLQSHLLARSTVGGFGIGVSHSWSPRTQIGATVSAGRSFSRYQDAYQTVADVQFGRALSRGWLMQLHAGSGFMEGLRVTNRLPSGPQVQGGGSLVFKTASHTFMGGGDRMFGDAYGMGAASTLILRGAWNWARPGANWVADAGFAQQYYRRSVFGSIDGWHATAGVARRVSGHTSVHLEYMRLSYGGQAGVSTRAGQSAVRVVFAWNASPIRTLSRQE